MKRHPSDLVIDTLRTWSARWPDDRDATLVHLGPHDEDLLESLHRSGLPIDIARSDARPADTAQQLGSASFDYALVGTALHTLHDIERLTTLRAAERVARQGLLWVGVIDRRHAFSRAEVLDIRRRLSMGYLAKSRLPRLGGPFLLAGEFADAWTGLGRNPADAER